MKKVLSVILAVLMIVSTVTITGIVSSLAADTNPSDDAYVYYTDASDGRKSGFAYDFEDFTIDPAKLSDYEAEMWIYIGRVSEDVTPEYDFLISLYTEGHYDATVGSNYTEKWALRKEWKTGNLNEGWNKVTMPLSSFTLGSTGNTAYNQPAYAAFQQSGKLIAMTLHENSQPNTIYGTVNIGVSSFVITDGSNTYNVINPDTTKSNSQIVNTLTTNTRSGAVRATLVSQLPVPESEEQDPVEVVEERITLIDPAASKNVADMYQIGASAAEKFSVVNTSTLTGGTSGVPSSTAYYVDQISAEAKTGGMIKVGGEDGVNIANLADNFLDGELYVNAWVWVNDPSTDNIIFRMFNRYDKTGFTNYIETSLSNNSVGVLTKGWNYISANITAVIKGTANPVHGQAYQQFAVENVIDYIAFYYHNTCTSDVAVAAVELSNVKGNSKWDVNIEGTKLVYKNGVQPVSSDFILTDKGVVVDPANYTVSAYDTTKAGRQFVTVTYNSTEYPFEIYNKTTLGQATYHTTYSGESSAIAGIRNGDNAVIGASSVQHTAAGQAVSYHVATDPLNLYGENFLEMFIYLEKNVIDAMTADAATDAVRLLVEPTSNMGSTGKNGVRIALYDTFFINEGCKAGWNKIYIPLNPGTVGNSADSPQVNGVATNWAHDSQGSSAGAMYMDYERVTDFRIRFDKFAGSVALINAVGYGMDVSVDGKMAGNDINEAIKSAKAGSTVKLNWAVSINDSIKVDKDITFDFNGNDVSTTADKVVALNGGNITVVDTNTRYNHSISGANVYPANKGTFVAKSTATIFTGTGSETAYLNGTWTQNVTDGTAKIAGTAMFPLNESYKAGIGEMTFAEADDISVIYKGNWQFLNNLKGANNKSLMRSTDAGDSYAFAFEGTAIAVNAYTSPTYGKIEVIIDGESYGIIDLYSAQPAYQKHIFGAVVEEGLHSVDVITVDSKNANAQRPTLFYNALDSVEVVGEIFDIASRGAGFSPVTKNLTKNTATFKIDNIFVNGIDFADLTATAEKGIVTVEGDMIYYTATSQTDTITYRRNGLTGIINITVDSNVVFEAEDLCIMKNLFNEPIKNRVKYAWNFSGHEALILHYAEYVEFTFTGTGLDVISYKSKTNGMLKIFIDGVETKYFDLNSNTIDEEFKKTVYSVDGLENKEHLIQIVSLSDRANVDAFRLR